MNAYIYCPQCDHEFTLSNVSEIAKGQTIECESCSMKFNIFTVYKSYYEDIPAAKRIADTIITISGYKKYNMTGPRADVQLINEFFGNIRFNALYMQIIPDLAIYGNAFVERNSGRNTLVRHDPATSIIETEMMPGHTIPEEVVYLTTKDRKKIPSNDLTHFAIITYIPPFGDSRYGYWFSDWQKFKLYSKALINSSILRNQGDRGQKPEEILERKRELGKKLSRSANVDPAFFEDGSQPLPGSNNSLLMDARKIQAEIADKVERYFPLS